MRSNPDYITAEDFAKRMNVPMQAVNIAIEMHALPADETIVEGIVCIPVGQLQTYEFDIIGVYEYARRKRVAYKSVYAKAYKGIIKYYLDEADLMKIDWNLFKDVHFRINTFRHRKTNGTVGYLNDPIRPSINKK